MDNKLISNWLAPVLLLLLGSLNILFGALQLDTIYQGPPEVPDEFSSMHYHTMPIPIVMHIVAGIIFNLLGPLQFAPVIRRKWPKWHRCSGRTWIVLGVIVAGTGLWMNEFYPMFGGFLKYTGVLTHSLGLFIALILALRAILRRNISRHRIWMMRAIAIGLGPATQRLFILPVFFAYGMITEFMAGFVVWFGILLNLGVVESILFRQRQKEVKRKGRYLREVS